MLKKVLYLLALAGILTAPNAFAETFETKAKQAVLLEEGSGTVLYAKEANTKMYPSSMTKIMTVYLLLERLKQGALKLEDQFAISEAAWRIQGSKTFVKLGDFVKVEDLLRGIIVQSGNDACVAVAEGLAGSEENFAKMMNTKAQELGLKGSHFMNSNGWPDPNHYTTAHDLAILAERIHADFPEYYHYWAEPEFTYNGIRQYNRNLLLGELGVDGLKTGHTEAAGYGITVTSQQPDGRRLVVVVNGLTSEKERAEEARKLLQYGIHNFETVTIAQPGQKIENVKTWFATQPEVALTVDKPIQFTLPKFGDKKIAIKAKVMEPLPAPLPKGSKAGELSVSLPGMEPQVYPLLTTEPVEPLSAGQRFFPSLKYRLFGAP